MKYFVYNWRIPPAPQVATTTKGPASDPSGTTSTLPGLNLSGPGN